MSDETDSQQSAVVTDPIELWKQWNETTSKAWVNALQQSAEATTNSYGLYRSWIQGVGENVNKLQEQANANPFQMMNPGSVWKTWFDATMETWKKAVDMDGDPLGLTRQWLKMMEQAREKLLAGTPLQTDPFTLFKQWYDASSEQWSQAVEKTISSKQFLESTRPLLESYASVSIAFKRASEEYFKHLQLPTTTDIANVAQLVINLEEKIDTIDDSLERFQDAHAQAATLESITHLEQRLDQLTSNETVSGFEQRLHQVESKLDNVLAVLAKLEQRDATSGGATARKTQKKSVSQPKVQE